MDQLWSSPSLSLSWCIELSLAWFAVFFSPGAFLLGTHMTEGQLHSSLAAAGVQSKLIVPLATRDPPSPLSWQQSHTPLLRPQAPSTPSCFSGGGDEAGLDRCGDCTAPEANLTLDLHPAGGPPSLLLTGITDPVLEVMLT